MMLRLHTNGAALDDNFLADAMPFFLIDNQNQVTRINCLVITAKGIATPYGTKNPLFLEGIYEAEELRVNDIFYIRRRLIMHVIEELMVALQALNQLDTSVRRLLNDGIVPRTND
jgi:hypothetical protein